ncbi:MAG TPA: hypothetical protein VJ738_21030 [Steroidobacteraceae bacterium]|nr:hypothetical protein [Steroidobacteraceae bacterium]
MDMRLSVLMESAHDMQYLPSRSAPAARFVKKSSSTLSGASALSRLRGARSGGGPDIPFDAHGDVLRDYWGFTGPVPLQPRVQK